VIHDNIIWLPLYKKEKIKEENGGGNESAMSTKKRNIIDKAL